VSVREASKEREDGSTGQNEGVQQRGGRKKLEG
jgi:hypothetical protein